MTQMSMNCRFEILTVFKDFMFKNECAPRQFMVTHPTVAFLSRRFANFRPRLGVVAVRA